MNTQHSSCSAILDSHVPPKWHRWILASLFALLAVRFALFAIAMGFLVPVRSDLTFPEGAVVAGALDVARGDSAYHDWREWPHAFAPYGPLTYYPVGWLTSISGDVSDPWSVYLLGRLQSYLAMLMIAGCALLLGRSLGLAWIWCAAIVTLFCVWEQVFSYVASYRPDAPQVACSLLALVIMLRRTPSTTSSLLVFSILSVAMWFKPSAWGMIAFTGIWLWSSGARRTLLTLTLFGAANLLVAVILNAFMDQRLFLNMISSLDNGIVWANVPGFYRQLPFEVILIFLMGGGSLLYLLRAGDRRRTLSLPTAPSELFAMATFASWAVTTLLNFKEGADVNYYLETYVLLCVLCVWGLRAFFLSARSSIVWSPILVGVLLISWAIFTLYSAVNGYPAFLKSLKTSWGRMGVEEFVQRSYPGPLFTTNPFLALARGDQRSLIDHFQFSVLVRRGKLDSEGLLGRIRREEFELIVLSASDWNEPREDFICDDFVETLKSHYRLDGPIGGLVALRPIHGGPTLK